MNTIITKRHPFNFYLAILFAFSFLFFLASLLFKIIYEGMEAGDTRGTAVFFLLVSLLTYVLAFYTLYAYFKNTPIVHLDEHFIQFEHEKVDLKDIDQIKLTGKMPFKFVITFPMEGSAILTKNNKVFYLYDSLYTNSWEIKSFLARYCQTSLKSEQVSTNTILPTQTGTSGKLEIFKGHTLTSMRGIMLWSLTIMFVFVLLSLPSATADMNFFVLTIIMIFWFIMGSWFMHYFMLSADCLYVKNHTFIWMNKSYAFTDISEIVFETKSKRPNCMRVITKDYKSTLYPAGTLSDKTWLRMKSQFESKGIKVRNECIYGAE